MAQRFMGFWQLSQKMEHRTSQFDAETMRFAPNLNRVIPAIVAKYYLKFPRVTPMGKKEICAFSVIRRGMVGGTGAVY